MALHRRLGQLHEAGVSIWLDTLSRQLLAGGRFAELIRDYAITGATSNPTIFAKALGGSDLYDEQLERLRSDGVHDLREVFFALALDDVREAARLLRPEYDRTGGRDGFISFECTPDIADDAEATIRQAWELWRRLDTPNVMIKVPATPAGVPAVEELTRRGVNVNITLLFSLERYEEVIAAYLGGLTTRANAGEPIDGIASVASFFLSRIDSKVDARVGDASPMRGRVAVASAKIAYQRYRAAFSGEAWERLAALGAREQRLLWASTGTKNPAYSDTLYVSELIGRDVVNTMPEATLSAFADHGTVETTLERDLRGARLTLRDADAAGIDRTALGIELEREGVEAFRHSYRELLDGISHKVSGAARAQTAV